MRLVAVVMIAVGVLSLAAPCSATSRKGRPSLSKVVALAELFFAGTVDRITYRRAEHGMVVTDVTFKDVRFVKGYDGDSTLILTNKGGVMDGRAGGVGDYPVFSEGMRYVVLAGDHGRYESMYLPIVGLYDGFFPIRPDPKTGRPVVLDWLYKPILGISQDRVVVPTPYQQDTGARMSEEEFLSALRGLGGE